MGVLAFAIMGLKGSFHDSLQNEQRALWGCCFSFLAFKYTKKLPKFQFHLPHLPLFAELAPTLIGDFIPTTGPWRMCCLSERSSWEEFLYSARLAPRLRMQSR
jgi:hypothetical protein